MDALSTIFLNIIYILFPLLCYLFYIAYQSDCGKDESDLALSIVLFTSLYLCFKVGNYTVAGIPILLINIPVLIAYLKNKPSIAIIMSIFIMGYYYVCFPKIVILIIIEYILYLICFSIFKKNKFQDHVLINIAVLIKSFFLSFTWFYLANVVNNAIIISEIFIITIITYILTYTVILLMQKGEEIASIHMTIKELEKEKTIRSSLFKITHEIKNPIAVCKGYLDMIDVNNIHQVEKYIPIIRQEIDRTLSLMNDFLSLTKIKIEPELVDINVLIDDVCTSIDSLMLESNITFNYEIIDNELYLMGDYNRLKQVLINILKNSVEAMSKNKKGHITLRTFSTHREYKIIIEDNGIGMNKETLNKISEIFYTTKNKGTGIGVFLSQEIINAHHGHISYTSKVDVGTTVTIRLPLYNAKRHI